VGWPVHPPSPEWRSTHTAARCVRCYLQPDRVHSFGSCRRAACLCVRAGLQGGPVIPWRPGRADAVSEKACTPDGRLPDALKGADHIRAIFGRMGFNDQEIVALSGAHALGRCHTDRSGFTGPWTRAPTTFSNEYYRLLLEEKWVEKTREGAGPWKGPKQFTDSKTGEWWSCQCSGDRSLPRHRGVPSPPLLPLLLLLLLAVACASCPLAGELMMLVTDLLLVSDPGFAVYTKKYAADKDAFFKDFAAAFAKLEELGVPFESKTPLKFTRDAKGNVLA